MSQRELRGLRLSGETAETVGTRSGTLFKAMSESGESDLASRLAVTEEMLATAREECRLLEARVRQLQEKAKGAELLSELDKLKALDLTMLWLWRT